MKLKDLHRREMRRKPIWNEMGIRWSGRKGYSSKGIKLGIRMMRVRKPGGSKRLILVGIVNATST